VFAPNQDFLILAASRNALNWCGNSIQGILLVRQDSFMVVVVRVITDILPFSVFGTLPAFLQAQKIFLFFLQRHFSSGESKHDEENSDLDGMCCCDGCTGGSGRTQREHWCDQ
jgi:hypothetical protein